MSTESLLAEKVLDENQQLYYEPSTNLIDDQSQDFMIFMITGNPGLIKFYEPFLSTLHNLLSSSSASPSARFYICGNSLAGFGHSKGGMGEKSAQPKGLQDQINHLECLLFDQARIHRKAAAATGKPLKVILMGHSVGAYILLELIQRHRKQVETLNEDFDLIGGILLFPTITHLAQSPQGMIYSVSRC